MIGFRRWIAVRLWRRLAFYHSAAIFGALVIVQLAVAIFGAGTTRELAPPVPFASYLFGATLGIVPALLLSTLVAAISGVIVSRSLGKEPTYSPPCKSSQSGTHRQRIWDCYSLAVCTAR